MDETLDKLGEIIACALPGSVTSHSVVLGELTINAVAGDIGNDFSPLLCAGLEMNHAGGANCVRGRGFGRQDGRRNKSEKKTNHFHD